MKAADFDYLCASSVPEACRALAQAGDARLIAGGQTLVPLMAMRLARPGTLIDIARIPELRGITLHEKAVTIRACTTQAEALESTLVRTHLPLLAKALPFVGHDQTRNRGTIGGSLANADPAAEITLVAAALEAQIEAQSPSGKRLIASQDFFKGAMTTALRTEECLTEVRFPAWNGSGAIGTGFEEMSVRKSDFALVAVAAQILLDAQGVCRRAAIAVGGIAGTPFAANGIARELVETRLAESDIDHVARTVQAGIEPHSDIHASADYRRRVAGALLKRVIIAARDDALSRKR
jgi:CO/xanthine dehydrogenase FAD-binding subunit